MRFVVLLLLLCQPIHAATKWMFGAELNHIGEITQGSGAAIETTIKKTGCCSLRLPAGGTYSFLNPSSASLAATTLYLRFYLYVTVTTPPTGSTTVMNGMTLYNGATDVSYIRVVVTTGGAVSLRLYNAIGAAQVGSDYSITTNTWYLIEERATVVSGSTSTLEMKVDGVSRALGSGNQNLGSAAITQIVPTAYASPLNSMSANLYYDDVLASDSAYPGAGRILVRQAGAGTPTYTGSWTASSGTLPTVWQDIPFASPYMNSSTTAPSTQTFPIATFSSTQTNHGTETIGASDTINAVQGLVAAVLGAGTCQIIRRVNSVDTTAAMTGTAGLDLIFREAIWTDTLTNINAMELGGKLTVSGSSTHIYDIYVQVDSTVSSATPVTLIPLLSRRRR